MKRSLLVFVIAAIFAVPAASQAAAFTYRIDNTYMKWVWKGNSVVFIDLRAEQLSDGSATVCVFIDADDLSRNEQGCGRVRLRMDPLLRSATLEGAITTTAGYWGREDWVSVPSSLQIDVSLQGEGDRAVEPILYSPPGGTPTIFMHRVASGWGSIHSKNFCVNASSRWCADDFWGPIEHAQLTMTTRSF